MQGIQRLAGFIYLILLYLLVNAVFRYIYSGFLMFCVLYTCSDLLKKKRKYLWIIKMVKGNAWWLTIAIVGEQTVHTFLCTSSVNKRKFDKKPTIKNC